MKTKLFLFLFLFNFFSNQSFAKTDVEFLVDFSGSMRKVSDGETQVDSARKALSSALQSLGADTQAALRLYGHRVEQTDKAKSCEDTELVVPFAENNREAIENAVKTLQPKGYTPIAYSLLQSKNDFSLEREAKKVIILLSDGEETCNGDPVSVLKQLQAEGFEVVVHTVGFNVDDKTRAQLEAIANASGGKYFDAKGAEALNTALVEAAKESAVVEKEKSIYGEAIRGGDSYETAVELPLNKELKLDHHQKAKFYDYFFLDLRAGQEFQVVLKTLETGIHFTRDSQFSEGGAPYAGLEVHNSERKRIAQEIVIAAAHANKTLLRSVTQDGRYYLLVGNDYESQHKDHVTFEAKIITKGDLGADQDAGHDMKTALPILPGRYEVNYIGGADQQDVFSFSAKKGDRYMIGLIPNEEITAYFAVELWDDFKMPVGKKYTSPSSNSGLKAEPIEISLDGTYYFQVSLPYGTVNTFRSYTLIFQKLES